MENPLKASDLEILAEREVLIRASGLALDTLRSDQTRSIVLARSSGCTWAEIAQALGVSPQAAQQRHAKALQRAWDAAQAPRPE